MSKLTIPYEISGNKYLSRPIGQIKLPVPNFSQGSKVTAGHAPGYYTTFSIYAKCYWPKHTRHGFGSVT